MLFSEENNSLDILNDNDFKDIDKSEVYKDAIIICLKEIKENAKLYGVIEKEKIDKTIERWTKELNKILVEIHKNE